MIHLLRLLLPLLLQRLRLLVALLAVLLQRPHRLLPDCPVSALGSGRPECAKVAVPGAFRLRSRVRLLDTARRSVRSRVRRLVLALEHGAGQRGEEVKVEAGLFFACVYISVSAGFAWGLREDLGKWEDKSSR